MENAEDVRDESTRPATGRGHLRAFLSLPLAERAWFLHALIYVWGIRLALARLPLAATQRRSRWWGRALPLPSGPRTIPRAVASLDRASGVVRGGGNCFVRALALQTLLAHRGIPSEVHVGFRATPEGAKEGHAWLVHDGRILVGEIEELAEFRLYSTTY